MLLGGVCGGDSFGARFRGPNGSHGRHSSQALPTDQVAVHRAPLDHRSLPIPELVPTLFGPYGWTTSATHTQTHCLWLPPLSTPTPEGQLIQADTCAVDRNEKHSRTHTHTRGVNEHATLSFSHIRHANPPVSRSSSLHRGLQLTCRKFM